MLVSVLVRSSNLFSVVLLSSYWYRPFSQVGVAWQAQNAWKNFYEHAVSKVVQKDCQPRKLNRNDAMDRGRWKKLMKVG